MKNYSLLSPFFCDCSGKIVQTKGETCEICNGNLPLLEDTLAEILPESRFDEDYFEELERYFESRPIAA